MSIISALQNTEPSVSWWASILFLLTSGLWFAARVAVDHLSYRGNGRHRSPAGFPANVYRFITPPYRHRAYA